jgi:broad-specificity NMP kinase
VSDERCPKCGAEFLIENDAWKYKKYKCGTMASTVGDSVQQTGDCLRAQLQADNARLQGELAETEAEFISQNRDFAAKILECDKLRAQLQRYEAVVGAARYVSAAWDVSHHIDPAIFVLRKALADLEVGK